MESLTVGGVRVNFGHAASVDGGTRSIPLRNRRLTVVGYSGAWTTPDQRRDTFERLMGIVAGGGTHRAAGGGLSLDSGERPPPCFRELLAAARKIPGHLPH